VTCRSTHAGDADRRQSKASSLGISAAQLRSLFIPDSAADRFRPSTALAQLFRSHGVNEGLDWTTAELRMCVSGTIRESSCDGLARIERTAGRSPSISLDSFPRHSLIQSATPAYRWGTLWPVQSSTEGRQKLSHHADHHIWPATPRPTRIQSLQGILLLAALLNDLYRPWNSLWSLHPSIDDPNGSAIGAIGALLALQLYGMDSQSDCGGRIAGLLIGIVKEDRS